MAKERKEKPGKTEKTKERVDLLLVGSSLLGRRLGFFSHLRGPKTTLSWVVAAAIRAAGTGIGMGGRVPWPRMGRRRPMPRRTRVWSRLTWMNRSGIPRSLRRPRPRIGLRHRRRLAGAWLWVVTWLLWRRRRTRMGRLGILGSLGGPWVGQRNGSRLFGNRPGLINWRLWRRRRSRSRGWRSWSSDRGTGTGRLGILGGLRELGPWEGQRSGSRLFGIRLGILGGLRELGPWERQRNGSRLFGVRLWRRRNRSRWFGILGGLRELRPWERQRNGSRLFGSRFGSRLRCRLRLRLRLGLRLRLRLRFRYRSRSRSWVPRWGRSRSRSRRRGSIVAEIVIEPEMGKWEPGGVELALLQRARQRLQLLICAVAGCTTLDDFDLSRSHVRLRVGIIHKAIGGIAENLKILRSAFAGTTRHRGMLSCVVVSLCEAVSTCTDKRV